MKIQPDKYLAPRELRDVVIVAAFNMIILAPFVCCPLFELMWDAFHPVRLEQGKDPFCWQRECALFLVIAAIAETSFYLTHMLLHQSFLYKHIHKIHHRFKAPTALVGVYAHPLEFIFSHVFSIVIGPAIVNAHPYTTGFCFSVALFSVCKGHSGYAILNATKHDDHHLHTNGNYSPLHVLDLLMGTAFVKTAVLRARVA